MDLTDPTFVYLLLDGTTEGQFGKRPQSGSQVTGLQATMSWLSAEEHWLLINQVFGEGVKSARGATAILAGTTTLETCLERPFTRAIVNELLHSNQQKNAIVCQPLQTVASHELWHDLLQQNNYCGNTPCGIHPFSELPNQVRTFASNHTCDS